MSVGPSKPTSTIPAPESGAWKPLANATFRQIWIASLFSNFGLLVQGVGAAWTMASIASAQMVALVQTASYIPYVVFAVAAGAMADMYDRRKVQIVALTLASLAALTLTLLSWTGLITPALLLMFCFLIGCGQTLFGPAWQASASEQVGPRLLPAAIALNSSSFNIARCVGPAIGGMIVALAGASAAFLLNALFYVPLLVVLLRWRRRAEPPRLPPERLGRAIVSGLRYVFHAPAARTVVIRALAVGMAGAAPSALMPLVARDLLGGGSPVFGILLGSVGIGSVVGALVLGRLRRAAAMEVVVSGATIVAGIMVLATSFSHVLIVTVATLLMFGAAWTVVIATLNIGIQVPSPRWVSGRAVATFLTTIAGGVAIGSWLWGMVAQRFGIGTALAGSGVALVLTVGLGLFLRLHASDTIDHQDDIALAEPEITLAITNRSGPIQIEVEYRVAADQARDFYHHMQEIQRIRSRNGGARWSLGRDIADPEGWIERFECPTWLDYIRQRTRMSPIELAQMAAANDFHPFPQAPRVRRTLVRPFGSVRWKDAVPDEGGTALSPMTGPMPSP